MGGAVIPLHRGAGGRQMGVAHGATRVMLPGVARGPAEGLALPGDEVQVGRAGALDDHQLAGALQRVLHFVDALAADVDVVIEGGIRGPGDPTAVVGVDREVQQEGAGTAFGLGFFADMVYDRYRHGELTPFAGALFMSWGSRCPRPASPFYCGHGLWHRPWGLPTRYSSTTKLAPRLLTSSLGAPSGVAPAPGGLPVRPAAPPARGPSGPRRRAPGGPPWTPTWRAGPV